MATFIGNIGVPRIDRHIKLGPFGDMAAAAWRQSVRQGFREER